MDDSKRKADQAYAMKYVNENNGPDPEISGGTPSNNDLRDILRVLQKQKEGIQVMRVSVDQNAR